MEKKKFPGTHNPLLDEILQKYRDCSTDSISGPKALTESRGGKYWRSELDTKHIVASSHPSRSRTSNVFATKMPAKDQKGLKFKETLIDGIPMACFSYGGEKRLCYNQLVTDVLKEFSSAIVNETRDRLRVYCPRSTPQQLEIFKLAGVLSWSCSSSSLITKSDCFRLIGTLVGNRVPRRPSRIFSVESFEVYHECFGGCVGTLEVELYTDPYAKCITCAQCDGIFSPRKFVTHNHSSGEPHTCHWGFDSAKWRLYLMLCNEHPNHQLQGMWEMLMTKFADNKQRKRRAEEALPEQDRARDISRSPEKKSRIMNGTDSIEGRKSHSPQHGFDKSLTQKDIQAVPGQHPVIIKTEPGVGGDIMSRRSAFRPWSPTAERTKPESRVSGESSAGSSPTHPHTMTAQSTSSSLASSRAHNAGGPATVHYLNTDCPCGSRSPNKPHVHYTNFVEREAGAGKPGEDSRRLGDVISTPNSTDPRSIERTAKDMLEVVAQNDRWVECEASQSQEKPPDKPLALFSEEHIYQTLLGHMQSDSLPSLRELSVSLAVDVKDVLTQQENGIRELLYTRDKLHAQLASLKKEHADKIEEVYDELKDARKELRHLRVISREELEEKTELIRTLQMDVKQLKAVRDELLSRNSKDSIDVMQQEVRDLSNNLDEREKRCSELQAELKALRSVLSSRTLHNTTSNQSAVQAHDICGQRRDTESVIRSVHLMNGNSKNRHNGRDDTAVVKSNGVIHYDSSDDEH